MTDPATDEASRARRAGTVATGVGALALLAAVVVFSLLVSLLDATTVVPMLASRIIRDGDHMEESEDDTTHHHRTGRAWPGAAHGGEPSRTTT